MKKSSTVSQTRSKSKLRLLNWCWSIQARTIQARRFESVSVRLSPKRLLIGNASYDPGQVKRVEIVTDHITLPRDAVGLGLVKLSCGELRHRRGGQSSR